MFFLVKLLILGVLGFWLGTTILLTVMILINRRIHWIVFGEELPWGMFLFSTKNATEIDIPGAKEKLEIAGKFIKEDLSSPIYSKTILFHLLKQNLSSAKCWVDSTWGEDEKDKEYELNISISERLIKNCPAKVLASILAHEMAHLEDWLICGDKKENHRPHWLIDKRAGELTSAKDMAEALRWLVNDKSELIKQYPWSFWVYDTLHKITGGLSGTYNFTRRTKNMLWRISMLEKENSEHQDDSQRFGVGSAQPPGA